MRDILLLSFFLGAMAVDVCSGSDLAHVETDDCALDV